MQEEIKEILKTLYTTKNYDLCGGCRVINLGDMKRIDQALSQLLALIESKVLGEEEIFKTLQVYLGIPYNMNIRHNWLDLSHALREAILKGLRE